MGTSSTFDRQMISMGTQKGGASSSTRLQPQLTSSSLGLGLTPVFGTTSDVSGMFASVMTSLEELQQDMTERIDGVEERAQQGHQMLRDELADRNLQARSDQAQLIPNNDQCLAESMDLATKESEERVSRMTREIEQL